MRTTRFQWAALSMSVALVACAGGDELTSPGDDSAALQMAIVSGDGQPGKTGEALGEPFVVRVTDPVRQGVAAVAGVEVTWTVSSGEGVLQGRWEMCSEGGGLGDPARAVSTFTDADGLTRLSFMPTSFGPVTVSAKIAGARGSPVTFATDATDPGAELTVVSGNDQEMVAGAVAGPGRQPLVVRVTDGDGNGVPYVAVGWDVGPGRGSLRTTQGCAASGNHGAVTRTLPRHDMRGEAAIEFSPRWLNVATVTASVPGLPGPPAAFTVETNVLAIGLEEAFDPWSESDFVRFVGIQQSASVTWAIGAAVEFWSQVPAARIASTSVPPGGASFDSGSLSEGERFRFVPDAAGTWEFVDQVSGAKGTLSTVVVIHLLYDPWTNQTGFSTSDTVPPGMGIEFRNRLPTAHITSTSTPPGGSSFDSGPLSEGERFLFVPDAAGTWTFVDQVGGVTGTFTVQ